MESITKPKRDNRLNGRALIGWIVTVVVLLALCIVSHRLWPNSALNYISIFGSVASFFGIVVAIKQILSLKSKTEAVEEALLGAKTEIADLNVFSDVTKYSQLVNEIEAYINNKNIEEALVAYKMLKDDLIILLGYIEKKDNYALYCNDLKQILGNAGSDVNYLRYLRTNKTIITLTPNDTMFKNLEKIKDFLNHTAGLLKSKKI